MNAAIALIITFFVGFAFKVKGYTPNRSLILASFVTPSLILIAKFVLPYRDAGPSMWPIALLFGTVFGVIAGGLGIVAGAYFLKWKSKYSNKS